ncbi:hypothetical protein OKA04_01695 [Luteolibacter flavescens]|uniref:Uncharacterized protein n=1 Tax=Luteolibacter flavescens TaxID=1859460 RepID=A0ABT3FIM7_9BACT|nr:hypothetical protein [Luteolibacter flavescens]MCW1883422.1 hypothetical protein [Luteolibacter flavescens]
MKRALLPLVVLGLFVSLSVRGEEPRRSGKGLEVLPADLKAPNAEVTNDAAFIARRNAAGAGDPKPVPKQAKGYGLAELSVFLSKGDTHTILPKGSIIYCPDKFSSLIANRAAGKPVAWPDFLIANRNWVSTHEVTLAQVRGEAPLSEEDRKAFATAGHLVVATLRGNPITVLPVPATKP